jgi:FkbM family methyltransferase
MFSKVFLILKLKKLIKFALHRLYKLNYSTLPQEGETAILRRLFQSNNGFYVDIGAYHPFIFSNTLMLYKFGWNGINIEPNCVNFKQFVKHRKRDINLNCAISGNNKKKLYYYEYLEPALNTTSETQVQKRKNEGINYINKRAIKCEKLGEILNRFCRKKKIDFLNIDTEGTEAEILKTNNWKKFKPKVIFCEILNCDLEQTIKNKITIFLKSKGYKIFAKFYNNAVYIHKSFYKDALN